MSVFRMAPSWTNPSFVKRHWKFHPIRAARGEFPDSASSSAISMMLADHQADSVMTLSNSFPNLRRRSLQNSWRWRSTTRTFHNELSLQQNRKDNIFLRRLTTGMRSEKCVVRRFRRCANVIQCTYTNLDSIAYFTPMLCSIAYCS